MRLLLWVTASIVSEVLFLEQKSNSKGTHRGIGTSIIDLLQAPDDSDYDEDIRNESSSTTDETYCGLVLQRGTDKMLSGEDMLL